MNNMRIRPVIAISIFTLISGCGGGYSNSYGGYPMQMGNQYGSQYPGSMQYGIYGYGNNQRYQYGSQYPGSSQYGNYGYGNNQGSRSDRDRDDNRGYGGGYGQYRQHNDND